MPPIVSLRFQIFAGLETRLSVCSPLPHTVPTVPVPHSLCPLQALSPQPLSPQPLSPTAPVPHSPSPHSLCPPHFPVSHILLIPIRIVTTSPSVPPPPPSSFSSTPSSPSSFYYHIISIFNVLSPSSPSSIYSHCLNSFVQKWEKRYLVMLPEKLMNHKGHSRECSSDYTMLFFQYFYIRRLGAQ